MKRLIGVAILGLLAGCGPPADTTLHTPANTAAFPQGRFYVERIGVFDDDLAYNSKRGIYLITDNKTSTEYLGISGIGISELGRHSNGKTSSPDER